MWPKIYVLRPDPTTQRGKGKDDKEKIFFLIANTGITSKVFFYYIYIYI